MNNGKREMIMNERRNRFVSRSTLKQRRHEKTAPTSRSRSFSTYLLKTLDIQIKSRSKSIPFLSVQFIDLHIHAFKGKDLKFYHIEHEILDLDLKVVDMQAEI